MFIGLTWFLWVLGSLGNFCIVVYIIGNIEFGVKVRDLLVMVICVNSFGVFIICIIFFDIVL